MSQTFRTVLLQEKSNISIDYHSQILCIGSCFSENIGQLLLKHKFSILLNPFGILYNPLSINQSLDTLLNEKEYSQRDLVFHNELWHSFDHHGRFSHPDQSTTLSLINDAIQEGYAFLKRTDYLILTCGTAYVFEQKSTGQVVANCHKFPTKDFNRRRLTKEEITAALFPLFKRLKKVAPQLNIILTLSPVRHIRDGLVENQRSKATLLLAIETLEQHLDFVHYFPAYELVLDDLRDYRFFEKDMIHPNDIAIQYIWESFQKTYFTSDTLDIYKQVQRVVKAGKHRSLYPYTKAHQQFLEKQFQKILDLEQQYPFLNFSAERQQFGTV